MEVKNHNEESIQYWKDKCTLLKKDQEFVKSRCDNLESELSLKKSEILSMKIALNYSDSFTMRRETELREEIERLKKQSLKKTQKKKTQEKVLIQEITTKTQYIDDLVTKLQNLHQSLQYCKDDLSKYQQEYHEARYWLEIEKEHKEKYKQCLETTEVNLEKANHNFEILTEQLEVFKEEKNKAVRVLVEKVQDRSLKEIDEIRKKHEQEKKMFERIQAEKLEKTIVLNSETLRNVMKFTDEKIEELKAYYEKRINGLINELCTDEGKHQIEASRLSGKMSELIHQNHVFSQINEFLIEKVELREEELSEVRYKLNAIQSQQSEVDQFGKIEKGLYQIEIESLKTNMQDAKNQIISDYERQLKILQDQNEIMLKSLEEKHKSQLEKIHIESGELNNKERHKYELQIEFLINKIESLECQKSQLESRTIEKIETDNHGLIDKNEALNEEIRKLHVKIDQITKETEEKLKKQLISEYKLKIQSRDKKFQEKLKQNDIIYSTRVNNLTINFDKKIEENKKLAKQEFEAQEAQYLLKISQIEQNLERTLQDYNYKIKLLNDKIDDQKFEIDIINRQNFQKQLLINDMEEEFKSRVVFLQNQLTETEVLLQKVEKDCEESKERTQKEYAARFADALKKHEKEKTEINETHLKELSDVEARLNDKIAQLKSKYKIKIGNMNNTLGTTIDNLHYKLNYKSKVVKQQKSEIAGLKTQVRYLDSSSRMFTASSKSPISQTKVNLEATRRTTFLRPGSLVQYKKHS